MQLSQTLQNPTEADENPVQSHYLSYPEPLNCSSSRGCKLSIPLNVTVSGGVPWRQDITTVAGPEAGENYDSQDA